MTCFQKLLVSCLYFSLVGAWDDVIVSPPQGKIGDEVTLLLAQGASITTDAYKPLAMAIQNVVPFPLWVGIPQCPENVAAIPNCLKNGMERISEAMKKQGMNQTATFYGGHSLGGAMIPDYVNLLKDNAAGMILMGAFLTRKWKTGKTDEGRPQVEFPVSTLTIGGELDGLCRLPRIAEAHFTQIGFSKDPSVAKRRLPVTIIEGMSHIQFASGEPPAFVHKHDLRPEISEQLAHSLAAGDIASFMTAILEGNSSKRWAEVEKRVDDSGEFVAPIVNALHMEAYHQFLPPCYCETKDEYGGMTYGSCKSTAICTGGTPWTNIAQQLMGAGLTGLKINSTDSTHVVTETKPAVHLPHIHGNPNSAANPGNGKASPNCEQPSNCTLVVSTITQQIYDTDGEVDVWRLHFNVSWLDTGFLPISANEMKTKLKSRQALWEAAGVSNVSFADSDKPVAEGGKGERCAEINQAAIDWALNALPKKTVERYQKYGQKLQVGVDLKTCAAGPCWIWDHLKWEDDKKAGKVTIQSVWFGTENKNIFPCGEGKLLPCTAGFHYCKLVSPARVVEWMAVDSLRLNYSP